MGHKVGGKKESKRDSKTGRFTKKVHKCNCK